MAGSLPLHQQETEYSCAPACLKMVLEALGVTKTESELRDLCDCTSSGTDALRLIDAARKLGFSGTMKHSLILSELKELVAEGHYPIIYIRAELSFGQLAQPHAVVVEVINNAGIHLHDPMRGRIIYDVRRFEREWGYFHGLAIIVEA